MADQVRMPPPSIGGVVTLPARMTGAPGSDQESKNRGLQMSLVDPRAPKNSAQARCAGIDSARRKHRADFATATHPAERTGLAPPLHRVDGPALSTSERDPL